MEGLEQLLAGQQDIAQLLAQVQGAAGPGEEEALTEEQRMGNVKQVYSLFVQNELAHTSHTIEWLPFAHQDPANSKFSIHHFLLGQHIEGEDGDNKLLLCKLRLPNQPMPKTEVETLGKVNDRSNPLSQFNLSRLEIVKEIDHDQEVNKARAMPAVGGSAPKGLVASMTNSGAINLYSVPEIEALAAGPEGDVGSEQGSNRLAKQLVGLERESFALSWNLHKAGHLASAAEDLVCIWDVEKGADPVVKLEKAHVNSINDVRFSPHPAHGGNLLISTADDAHFKVWDLRTNNFQLAYKDAENSLCVGQFNPLKENIFAVAGDDNGQINIWDLRMPQESLSSFEYHSKQVTTLEWSPMSANILASGSDDETINLWDHNMVGSEQARGDYEDGPPELLASHPHHQSLIEDIQWVPTGTGAQQEMIASVETDRRMQVWSINKEFSDNELNLLHLREFITDEDLE